MAFLCSIVTVTFLAGEEMVPYESPVAANNATISTTGIVIQVTYNFSILYPGLMRKVNKDTVYIMTRNTEGEDDLDVLGVGNAEWKDNKIIFHSAYEKAIVEVDFIVF